MQCALDLYILMLYAPYLPQFVYSHILRTLSILVTLCALRTLQVPCSRDFFAFLAVMFYVPFVPCLYSC